MSGADCEKQHGTFGAYDHSTLDRRCLLRLHVCDANGEMVVAQEDSAGGGGLPNVPQTAETALIEIGHGARLVRFYRSSSSSSCHPQQQKSVKEEGATSLPKEETRPEQQQQAVVVAAVQVPAMTDSAVLQADC